MVVLALKQLLSGQQQIEMSKPSKAERLANNIRIMLKSKGASSFCINRRNEKALYLAIEQLGMRPNDFSIEADGMSYLEIRLKRNSADSTKIVLSQLNRPVWPGNRDESGV